MTTATCALLSPARTHRAGLIAWFGHGTATVAHWSPPVAESGPPADERQQAAEALARVLREHQVTFRSRAPIYKKQAQAFGERLTIAILDAIAPFMVPRSELVRALQERDEARAEREAAIRRMMELKLPPAESWEAQAQAATARAEAAEATAERLRVENERLQKEATICPLCRHEWRRHDPEDGCCDAGSDVFPGPCPCGPGFPGWMRERIAEFSRAALDPGAREALHPQPDNEGRG